MLTEVTIPKLTITMEGGTLLRWLKEEGARVAKDEVLFELETDKAITEVLSPTDGILKAILVPEGEVQVGTVVGFVGDLADPRPEIRTIGPNESKVVSSQPVLSQSLKSAETMQVLRATPAAKRRAKELGIDISLVGPTGPEGRITQEDVERAAAGLAEKAKETLPAGSLRTVIAEHVSLSWRTVPHIHIGGELRAAGLRQALEKARRDLSSDISVTDLLLYSAACLLPKFPSLNTVWEDERPVPKKLTRLAFAVKTDRGVVAPVLPSLEPLTLLAVSAERQRLMRAAQSRNLRMSDMEGGTFTLTNLGMFPVDFFVPIINYPQSAILATGRIRNRVEIRGGTPEDVPSMWVNLSVDHRVTDGAEAAEFLSELEKLFDSLEERISR